MNQQRNNENIETDGNFSNTPTGYAYSFFTRNLAPLANDLIALLEKCNQIVEPNLKRLATEYVRGEIIVDSCEAEEENDDEY